MSARQNPAYYLFGTAAKEVKSFYVSTVAFTQEDKKKLLNLSLLAKSMLLTINWHGNSSTVYSCLSLKWYTSHNVHP